MKNDWLRVFQHEITRRRRIAQENLDLYRKIHCTNPKGLLAEARCPDHIWVPASHLFIHDNGARSSNIGGIKTRGFSEAASYHEDGHIIIPQMCWKCDATRVHSVVFLTATQRAAEFKKERQKLQKPRGRNTGPIGSVFDSLFESP